MKAFNGFIREGWNDVGRDEPIPNAPPINIKETEVVPKVSNLPNPEQRSERALQD